VLFYSIMLKLDKNKFETYGYFRRIRY